jgi:hypothetical protein
VTGAGRWIFVALALAAGGSIAFVATLKPVSATAFAVFAAWLLVPYAIIAGILIAVRRRGIALLPWYSGALVVAVAGLAYLADVVLWHPDAQGGIAVLMAPLLQGVLAAVLFAMGAWRHRA